LGNGIVKRALELVTTPKDYPVWFNVTPVNFPGHKPVQYKYFVRSGGKFSKWEPFEGHRTLPAFDDGMEQNFEVHDEVFVDGAVPLDSAPPAAPSDPVGVRSGSSPPFGPLGNAVAATTLFGSSQPPEPRIVESPNSSPKLRWKRDPRNPDAREMKGTSPSMGSRTPGSSSSGGSDRDNLEELQLDGSDAVICVAFHLPVIIYKNEDTSEGAKKWVVHWDSDALLSRKKASRADHMRVVFVGCLRVKIPDEDQAYVTEELRRFRCVPVFLSSELYKTVYEGYINTTLWPAFHNAVDVYGTLPTLWWNGNAQEKQWEGYMTMNRLFASKIVEVFCSGDLIWIQDIGLLILPSFLVRRVRNANIGIFIHKAFPSSEIFRTLSVRADLLRGMLNANQVGFHLYEYARHFLTCCRRILGLKMKHRRGGHMVVEYQGREVVITVAHASVEPSVIAARLSDPRAVTMIEEVERTILNSKQSGKKIIIGIDRLERMCGLAIKLGAYEQFLEQHPEYIGRCVLVQYGTRCPSRGEDFVMTQKLVREAVARINRETTGRADGGMNPSIVYHEVDRVDPYHRTALYKVADLMLNTCVRQGLDLIPFEYIATKSECNFDYGVLALSEFASASRVLAGSVVFNPFATEEVAKVIFRCLTMNRTERRLRGEQNNVWVQQNSTAGWAEKVLTDLKRGRKNVTGVEYIGHGFGLGFKRMGVKSDFSRLDHKAVVNAYRSASNRVILLDVGGTITEAANIDPLAMFARAKNRDVDTHTSIVADSRRPPAEVLSALERIAADTKRNTVFLVSGEKRKVLNAVVGDSGENIGLAAEHGYTYRWCTEGSRWELSNEVFDDSWKDMVNEIMQIYTMRTTGSYIDIKGSAVIWRFQDTDTDFGTLQANELRHHLAEVLKSFPVQIILGKEHVEVRPEGVDKGEFVSKVLEWAENNKADAGTNQTLGQNSPANFGDGMVDFVLCIGDEPDDEPMFEKIYAKYEEHGLLPREGPHISSSVMGVKEGEYAQTRQGDMQTPTSRHGSRLELDIGKGNSGFSGGSNFSTIKSSSFGNDSSNSIDKAAKSRAKIFTATVGAKPSKARYFVHSSDDVGELLQALAKVSLLSQRTPRSRSMGDLRGFQSSSSSLDSADGSTSSKNEGNGSSAIRSTTLPDNFASKPNAFTLRSSLGFGKKRVENRRLASASMVNLAALANQSKSIGLDNILEQVQSKNRARNIDEYFDHLAEEDEEGFGIEF
jgi:trehalose 6-phosphate synthase/phosphatase